MSNFMKICPVGAKLFHMDALRDMTTLIVASHLKITSRLNIHLRLQVQAYYSYYYYYYYCYFILSF